MLQFQTWQKKVALSKVIAHLDLPTLFIGRWRFTGKDRAKAEEILTGLLKSARKEKLFEPKTSTGLFPIELIKKEFAIKMTLETKRKELPLQLVTIGHGATKKLKKLYKAHRYTEYFFLYGLAAEMTEALAELSHAELQKKAHVKRSHRISVGYKVWPNLKDQRKICQMLKAKKIGVSLSSSLQLNPEFATSALVIY